MSRSKSGINGLNISPEELKSFGEALKNEEFRKRFFEYAQELNDPDHRKKSENGKIAAESEPNENGEQSSKPEPGYVLQSSRDGGQKCFINVARCSKIDKPKSIIEQRGGARGLRWQVPHTCSAPREAVVDGKQCTVYEVLYHPDTLRMAETNDRFGNMVQDMACDAVEKLYKIKLDRENLRTLQGVKYLDVASNTAIRKAEHGVGEPLPEVTNATPDVQKPVANGGHVINGSHARESECQSTVESDLVNHGDQNGQDSKMEVETEIETETENHQQFTSPNYSVKYRYELEMQEMTVPTDVQVDASGRPSAIEVHIELPGVKSASELDVDVFERRLELRSQPPTNYHLNMRLSYEVVADDASARFDKKSSTLVINVPVRKQSAAKPRIEELVGVPQNQSVQCDCDAQPSDDALREDCSFAELEPGEKTSDDDSPFGSPRSSSASFSSLPDATCGSGQLHSILKVHSMPDGLASGDETFGRRRRRVSKSVSFSETLQIETPDYRKPVATAFRKPPPNALSRREKRAMQKRNRQPSGSDSNGETGSCERPAQFAKAQAEADQSNTSVQAAESAESSQPDDTAQMQAETKDDNCEQSISMLSDDLKHEPSEKSETPTCNGIQEVGEAKKKKKRNKRKKHVSGDGATPKAFANGHVDPVEH